MNKKLLNTIAILALLFAIKGCIVISFYPLYEPEDLFENDIILGDWHFEDNNETWIFTHPNKEGEGSDTINKKAYELHIIDSINQRFNVCFLVHLIEIDKQYYLDFTVDDLEYAGNKYPEKIDKFESMDINISGTVTVNEESGSFKDLLKTMHYLPVHSFAKLKVDNNELSIRWIDPGWLKKMIKDDKMHIKYEQNEDHILLTESSKKLKMFISKYGNDEIYGQEMTLKAKDNS